MFNSLLLAGWRRNWEPGRGKQYALIAVELNSGQSSPDVTLAVKSLGDELLVISPAYEALKELGAGYLAIALFPLYVISSPLLFYNLFTVGTERLFDGCCFVWIADAATGKTVAGESPQGIRHGFPQAKLGQLQTKK
jgi:hypothetical protein